MNFLHDFHYSLAVMLELCVVVATLFSANGPVIPDCSLNGEKNAAGTCVCDKLVQSSLLHPQLQTVTFPKLRGEATRFKTQQLANSTSTCLR